MSQAQYLSGGQSAYNAWRSQVPGLPTLSLTIFPGDTLLDSYTLFVGDAFWTAQGHNPDAGAVSWTARNPDGTVRHGRTWYHQKPTTWRWSPDCVAQDCAGDFINKPGLDYPTIFAHEIGHWWVLSDVKAPANCVPVLMWWQITTNQVKRAPTSIDVIGASLLYDQPVGTSAALFRQDVSPGRVSLTWFSADPAYALARWERSEDGVTWRAVGVVSSDGRGYIELVDLVVVVGHRYGYRLVTSTAEPHYSSEAWVDVPRLRLSLAVNGMPAVGRNGGVAVFTLPDAAPATLDVVDVAGRVVLSREVGPLGPGEHQWKLASDADLPAGVFWVRLRQGEAVKSTRLLVVR